MKFITETGSLYEVDSDNRRIRRMIGVNNPSPRQGKDGEWRPYDTLILNLGESACIFWDPKTTPLLEGSGGNIPATITSKVVKIERNEENVGEN
jgi:hypothetical protein